MNPGYMLVPDGTRVLFVSQDNVDPGVKHDDNWTSYIHPFNAQLLAFFNGKNTLEEVIVKASDFFGLTINEIEKIVTGYIENEKSFAISYNTNYMHFPVNVLVNKTKIQNKYKTYCVEDFILNGEADLTTRRTSFPLSINLELTMKCHTDCIYCYANRKMHSKEMPLEMVLSIIRQAKKIGVVNFDISGGEVLLHPHYKEVISELLINGYTPFISTKVPVKKDKLQTLKNIGVKEIQISLDSINPETLSKILNVSSNYADAIKDTVRFTEEVGLELRVHSIINSHNCSDEEIETLVNFLSNFFSIFPTRFIPAISAHHASQIIQMIMRFPVLVQLHQNIGRPPSFLPWKRQASGIDRRYLSADLDHRPVGMAEHNDVNAPGYRLFLQNRIPHGNIVVMPMRQPYFILSDAEFFFSGKPRKEIIIARHHLNRTLNKADIKRFILF